MLSNTDTDEPQLSLQHRPMGHCCPWHFHYIYLKETTTTKAIREHKSI